jgi:hypothetical protein
MAGLQVLEVLDCNSGGVIRYRDWEFSWFSSVNTGKYQDRSSIRLQTIPS